MSKILMIIIISGNIKDINNFKLHLLSKVLDKSSAGVITRGWLGTGLLDTESVVWNWFLNCGTTLWDTLRCLATSACDNPISIHLTALHHKESGKWFLQNIIRLSWTKLTTKLTINKYYAQNLQPAIHKFTFYTFFPTLI